MKRPRNVHLLFVHGVGRHSRLSSLLQAYQAIRSNLRGAEAPMTGEDPIPNWRLEEFRDNGATPFLKLTPRGPQPGPTDGVYFYEVNYSALAGVIRENQPLDVTHLFVGLDLAANVARTRLAAHPPMLPQRNGFDADHQGLARHFQRLTGVFVAATIPVLGLPSLILRKYTQTFVSTFIRFFEDVATFALDKNGEKLISAHVDHTVDTIRAAFKPGDTEHADDVFVIAAHSLGTVVVHSYLIRQWAKGGTHIPDNLLTFGSPIGFVCWVWLFLDYPRMDFRPDEPAGNNYFCWTPETGDSPAKMLQWINVVNYLDPIATAFPTGYIDLGRSARDIGSMLRGGRVEHRAIRTGGMASVGAAHTQYFDDRPGFLEMLGRLAQLRSGDPLGAIPPIDSAHWHALDADLLRLRWWSWGIGTACVIAYISALAWTYDTPWIGWLTLLYLWPQLTIGVLAFSQRLVYGGPTKRTYVERIQSLPWLDIAAFPYRLRRWLRLGRTNPLPMAAGPGWLEKSFKSLLSFVPVLLGMALPLCLAQQLSGQPRDDWEWLSTLAWGSSLFIAYFLYLMLFAVSELLDCWRNMVQVLGHDEPRDPR